MSPSFREGNEDYDITVQLQEADRRVIDVLHELMIPTPSGELVPLSTLAEIEFAGSIGDIVRINNERVVTVKANVDETKIPGPVARAQAEKILKDFPLPPGYGIKFTGEFEFQQESEDFLTKAFVIALLLIFLILVTMFNSVGQPFIIMTSVILSLGGAFLGLMLFQPALRHHHDRGRRHLPGRGGGQQRHRPDRLHQQAAGQGVCTPGGRDFRRGDPAAAGAPDRHHHDPRPDPHGHRHFLRLSQLAISWVSESSQWWRSMAVVVIFGLIVATFLTLVVVPDPVLPAEAVPLKHIRRFSHRLLNKYWGLYDKLAAEPADRP